MKNAEIVELKTDPPADQLPWRNVGESIKHYVNWKCPQGCQNYRLRCWLDFYDESKRGWENIYYTEVPISTNVSDVIETMVFNRPLEKVGRYRFRCQIGYWLDTGEFKYFDRKEMEYSFATVKPEKCSCNVVNQIFTSPSEVITMGHVMKAKEVGAPDECVKYIFLNTEKKAGDVFPECFEEGEFFTLTCQTTPTGSKVYLNGRFVGVT